MESYLEVLVNIMNFQEILIVACFDVFVTFSKLPLEIIITSGDSSKLAITTSLVFLVDFCCISPRELFQIWIYGNSFESFLVAIVNPNQQALEHWAEANGINGDFAALCANQKAKEYILGELAKIGKEKKVTYSSSCSLSMLLSSVEDIILAFLTPW